MTRRSVDFDVAIDCDLTRLTPPDPTVTTEHPTASDMGSASNGRVAWFDVNRLAEGPEVVTTVDGEIKFTQKSPAGCFHLENSKCLLERLAPSGSPRHFETRESGPKLRVGPSVRCGAGGVKRV